MGIAVVNSLSAARNSAIAETLTVGFGASSVAFMSHRASAAAAKGSLLPPAGAIRSLLGCLVSANYSISFQPFF